ncbi:gamma-glutamyltransferase [Pasteurellaceae bacterium LIM206]|nr:gamma-glutamyltransferase [Pasteurellaceae bacterium LIM206]
MQKQIRKKLAVSALSLVMVLAYPINLPASPASQPTTAAVAAQKYDNEYDIFHPIYAENGMVASEQELATRVGVDILQQGGNAIDAAVAVGFALAVVLPNAGNIGGGGFMVLHDAKSGTNTTVDFRETAPAKASRDMYLDKDGNLIDGKSLYSHQAVGIPGTVAGLTYALAKWGSLPLETVMAPAIKLAEQGYPVSKTLADMLMVEKDNLAKWKSSTDIFFKQGKPLAAGELLVQKDLAQSLKAIAAQGAKAFYEGDISAKIVAEMQKHGGLISREDLKNYRAVERQPIVGDYRDYQVITMPPPSSGGVHLVQMLNMLENYPVADFGVNSAKEIHYLAETMKLAYADRSEYLGDPDFVKIPVKGLTSKDYARSLIKGIDENKARPAVDIKPGKPQPYESDQTTHFSVMDKQGNAVAVTYTLNFNFGSGIVAEGTGILLNDEMDDFSAKPGVPNGFGLIGGEANAIAPNKRPLSSMTPTIVLQHNKPWLVTGSPGGARIITTVLQSIVNTIDHKMNPAEAIVTPRVHHQWLPDELRIEEGISPDTIALLQAKGHKVAEKAAMGRIQIIQAGDKGFYGYSDPRNPDGKTLGY